MRAGRRVPRGFIPVYSVDTEEEARDLIVLTCSSDGHGGYFNADLAAAREKPATTIAEMDAQLASLDVFSNRLDAMHDVLKKRGFCCCKLRPKKKGAHR